MSIRICVTCFPHRYRTTDLRRWRDITIDNVIYALDSTTISTSIKLAAWALEKYSKGAVMMHTLLDLRGSIPANIRITDGKWHDCNELDRLS